MARTQLTTEQVGSGQIVRTDLNTTTAGSAVITKVIAGSGVTISSTGSDAGTGDVTISSTIAPRQVAKYLSLRAF